MQPIPRRLALALALSAAIGAAQADSTPQTLPFAQDWTDTGLITVAMTHPEPQHAVKVVDEISRQFVRQNVERMSAEAASSQSIRRASKVGQSGKSWLAVGK